MKTVALAAVSAALLVLAAAPAAATPIYRCGQTYSQTPCPGGRLIDAGDPRSAAQQAEAREVAARERALAAELQRDRQDQEAAPRAQAAGFDSRPPPKAASQPAPDRDKKRRTTPKRPREVIVIVPRNNR